MLGAWLELELEFYGFVVPHELELHGQRLDHGDLCPSRCSQFNF